MPNKPFCQNGKSIITPNALFTSHAIGFIRQAIINADGNEVFFTGIPDDDGKIAHVKIFAQGNKQAVPALMDAAEFGHFVIHNHPSGILTPSSADIDIASILAQSGVGSCIVNNDMSECYIIVYPAEPETFTELNPAELSRLLEPEGLFAEKFDGFEHRPQQVEMLKMVSDALNTSHVAMIEAGTGTGKSMAYLLPLIYWSITNKERCVISTKTINLQEQLLHKDIPALKDILPDTFSVCLIKGKSNYLCKRKLRMILASPETHFDMEKLDELRRIEEWAEKTADGSLSDLNFIPSEEIWDAVCADSDSCTRTRCSQCGGCFITRARQKASAANILIVNHHLLFADIAIRKTAGFSTDIGILPPYKRIIIDEAHHIEDVATAYFGSQCTQTGVLKILGRFYQIRGKQQKGLWKVLYDKVTVLFPSTIATPLITAIYSEFMEGKKMLESLIRNFFHFLADFLSQYEESGNREIKWRIPADKAGLHDWNRLVEEPFSELKSETLRYLSKMKSFLESLEGTAQARSLDLSNEISELAATGMKLDRAISTIGLILFGIHDDTQDVRWIEVNRRQRIQLFHAPVSVADNIFDAVISQFPTVILTSATLTTEGNFDFLSHRLGIDRLNKEKLRTALIASPFDYKRQVLIGIPSDLPEPNTHLFHQELSAMVAETLKITEGRTFVLFTSFSLLDTTLEQVKHAVRGLHLSFLKQGDTQRHEMLNTFRNHDRAVLFGTDSFWEGVDVKGKSLECVILTRLPFRVPTDPIIEARVENIKRMGGNPFMDYIVPLAVVKFRQGFGRLIRTRQDRGCVLIMDKRVLTKNYGKRFLSSLPECRTIVDSSRKILGALEEFFC